PTHTSTLSLHHALPISMTEATVRRIWHKHGLKPHVVKTFKLSNDPQFIERLEDIVGLYLNPPEHALVLSSMRRAKFKLWIERNQDFRCRKGEVKRGLTIISATVRPRCSPHSMSRMEKLSAPAWIGIATKSG